MAVSLREPTPTRSCPALWPRPARRVRAAVEQARPTRAPCTSPWPARTVLRRSSTPTPWSHGPADLIVRPRCAQIFAHAVVDLAVRTPTPMRRSAGAACLRARAEQVPSATRRHDRPGPVSARPARTLPTSRNSLDAGTPSRRPTATGRRGRAFSPPGTPLLTLFRRAGHAGPWQTAVETVEAEVSRCRW